MTGAIESVYQAERVQRICHHLGLWCFNPLWKHDQKELLEELLRKGFKVIISGVFAYPLDEKWLGKQIDPALIERLVDLQQKYGISPSGEGGEIETTVLDAPIFKKKIEILDFSVEAKGNSGVFKIKRLGWFPNDFGCGHELEEGFAGLLRVCIAHSAVVKTLDECK